jgi:hypothetical protein
MYTQKDIESGAGLFTSGEHTLVYQRGGENVFATDGKNSTPAPGWHLAGGGRLLAGGDVRLEWCDLR